MAQSFNCNYVHIVFSTKDRIPAISEMIETELYRYIAKVVTKENAKALAIGGMPDHIHILLSVPGDLAVAKALSVIKANSSRWMKTQVRGFSWQRGYAAFSVSVSLLEQVKQYVRKQKEHHKRRDFKTEYISLLKKHGVEFDPKYVFD